jgi:hypothetical protein
MNLLEPSLPNLEILQIGFNLFNELGKSDESTPVAEQKIKGFEKLENLHLEGNKLVDWNQVLRLSRFPKYVSGFSFGHSTPFLHESKCSGLTHHFVY